MCISDQNLTHWINVGIKSGTDQKLSCLSKWPLCFTHPGCQMQKYMTLKSVCRLQRLSATCVKCHIQPCRSITCHVTDLYFPLLLPFKAIGWKDTSEEKNQHGVLWEKKEVLLWGFVKYCSSATYIPAHGTMSAINPLPHKAWKQVWPLMRNTYKADRLA